MLVSHKCFVFFHSTSLVIRSAAYCAVSSADALLHFLEWDWVSQCRATINLDHSEVLCMRTLF